MSFFIKIVTNGLVYVLLVFAIICPISGIDCIDTSSWEFGVPPSLCLAIIPLFLPSSLLVEGFADAQKV